jgi:hypothetical protein
MKSVNLTVEVPADRRITIQLPDDVEPGTATVTLMVQPRRTARGLVAALPMLNMKWPEGLSLRREDLYGDDGR